MTEVILENIKPWSAEYPELYRVILTLKKQGEVLESYGEWTGFRNICVKDGLFLVNGKAIKLKGVNDMTGMKIQDDALQKRICWLICI